MALVNLLGDFGLDREAIGLDREASMGLGQGHARLSEETAGEAGELRMLAAATEFRRAAAHSVLLSEWDEVNRWFERSGEFYLGAGLPYGFLMMACARSPRELRGRIADFIVSPPDRTQNAYLLVVSAAAGRELRGDLMEDLASASNSRIGILGLPVGAYLDLTLALQRRNRRDLERAAMPFLTAHSAAMRATIGSYHWNMMAMPFHPAEPDILSVLFCVEDALRQREQGSLRELLESVPLFPPSADLLRNALGERFGDTHQG